MAEAVPDNSAFISLRDARALLVEVWQYAPHLAEKDIREALWRRRIRYRVGRMHARVRRDAPDPTVAMFHQNADVARIDWEHSAATIRGERGGVTFYLIELYRPDVARLLPAAWRERAAASVRETPSAPQSNPSPRFTLPATKPHKISDKVWAVMQELVAFRNEQPPAVYNLFTQPQLVEVVNTRLKSLGGVPKPPVIAERTLQTAVAALKRLPDWER